MYTHNPPEQFSPWGVAVSGVEVWAHPPMPLNTVQPHHLSVDWNHLSECR